MKSSLPLLVLFAIAVSGQTSPLDSSECVRWQGTYNTALAPDDTYLGWPSELQLSFQREALSWGIKGESVPTIALAADRYRCTETSVEGTFSGAHMTGKFKLIERGNVFLLDASEVGNVPGELNWLGYVPNRPVTLHKSD